MAALNDSVIKPVKDYTALAVSSSANSSVVLGQDSLQPHILIQICATVAVKISPFAVAPVNATENSMLIPAMVPMVFKIQPGHRLNAISADGSTGAISITHVE